VLAHRGPFGKIFGMLRAVKGCLLMGMSDETEINCSGDTSPPVHFCWSQSGLKRARLASSRVHASWSLTTIDLRWHRETYARSLDLQLTVFKV
jgi:hypothetical protein